ncbi:MAG TPA: hypothetical protein VI911_10865 [Patescibacteria group bacterium]|nr:hypothetical protein [Patescibacteria group bacterium]
MDLKNTLNSVKENSTFNLCKNFAKVLVLDGRAKAAEGLETLAEKIDTTEEQKRYSYNFHKEMELRRAEKELAAVKT